MRLNWGDTSDRLMALLAIFLADVSNYNVLLFRSRDDISRAKKAITSIVVYFFLYSNEKSVATSIENG